MYRIIGADGREYGPVSTEQLRQWIAESRVNQQTRVRVEGSTEWKSLADFPELASMAPPPLTASIPAARPHVPNYLAQSILVTLFCCLPFGIPAIVFAAQVNGKLQAGDTAGALESSRKAKMWCWIAVGGWVLTALIYAVIFAVFGMKALQGIR
jgi:hypothetical protein